MAKISLREYSEQIEDTIAQGRYTEAVAHGKNILEQYPKHVGTYQLLGRAMLESGQIDYAADMFNRVLSANPEDMIAWIGMSEIYAQRQDIDAAIWYLERAFELEANNEMLEEELRQLYSQRDGVEVSRVQLTRGALARLYLKGGLLSRAINELRDLWEEQPERIDLSVALAEALWHNEQRLEASEVCQKTLDQIPYCIKANLILGEIWESSGREEGHAYLEKANALDPENRIAQELFGIDSPLPLQEVMVVPLDTTQVSEEPEWMASVEPTLAEERPVAGEDQLFDIASALETQIELPAWMEEVSLEGEVEESLPVEAPEPPVEEIPIEEEEGEGIPDWLFGISEETFEGVEESPEEIGERDDRREQITTGDGETLDWMAELETETEVAKDVPDWLAEEDLPSLEDVSLPDWMQQEETPSEDEALAWLEQIAAETEGDEQAQAVVEAHLAEMMDRPVKDIQEMEAGPPGEIETETTDIIDWMQDLRIDEEPAAAPALPKDEFEQRAAEAEEKAIPDWMQELRPTETAEVLEEIDRFEKEEAKAKPEAFPAAEMEAEAAAFPEWMEGEGVPSGDEALAWLEQLAAGKEEELQAQAQIEAEARLAEIMGRPAAEPEAEVEAEVEQAVEIELVAEAEFPWEAKPEAPPEPAMEVTEAAEEGAIPDWLQELRPTEAAEA
ncbi:MAG TPA: tetratricopeptide repeat protein, partial [Chloroflexi bacterium]|nr:tetratricopeptide repeat protein [Chloroflexota bacterium]